MTEATKKRGGYFFTLCLDSLLCWNMAAFQKGFCKLEFLWRSIKYYNKQNSFSYFAILFDNDKKSMDRKCGERLGFDMQQWSSGSNCGGWRFAVWVLITMPPDGNASPLLSFSKTCCCVLFDKSLLPKVVMKGSRLFYPLDFSWHVLFYCWQFPQNPPQKTHLGYAIIITME